MIDRTHWLYQHSPRDWIRAALNELERAKTAFEGRDRKGGIATCRRAAGMALNGMLALEDTPDARYGRSYMDHLVALAHDESAPAVVRQAAKSLAETPLPGSAVVLIRTSGADAKVLEATQDVMAHAYAMILKREPLAPEVTDGSDPR